MTFEEEVLLFCGTLQGKGEVCVCGGVIQVIC